MTEALHLLESLTVKERKEIPLEDFAWPEERKYPIDSKAHLDAAAKLIGRAPENKQAEIKARAIRIAKRKGFTLPQIWQDEEKDKKGTVESERPQKKIGTLSICWLEYNARSLNGRIYPKATCDRIYQSGLRKLADPNGLPVTCFVSHETANNNVNTELVGRVVKLWQEGARFYALIDLADTRAGRDMLALAEGGYLKSGSMRVLGVELMHDRHYDLPLVVCQEGIEPDLLGIDLTTRPGLADSARITQVLYESTGQQCYCEALPFDKVTIESKEDHPPAMPIPIFLQVALGLLTEARSSREGHMHVHDHLAGVLDEVFGSKHGSESARYTALIEGQLDEAGRAIAMKHAQRLAAAHDESARQLGMKCEGCYADMLPGSGITGDTDHDGDDPAHGDDPDRDGESQKEKKAVTETEMIAALKAKGFVVEAPKTPEQQRIEEQEAKLASLEARLTQLLETVPTPRQAFAVPSQLEEQSTFKPEPLYEDGDYLKAELAPKNWRALADRRVPWPADMDPKTALHELTPFLTARLLAQEASSAGRDISFFVKPDEII